MLKKTRDTVIFLKKWEPISPPGGTIVNLVLAVSGGIAQIRYKVTEHMDHSIQIRLEVIHMLVHCRYHNGTKALSSSEEEPIFAGNITVVGNCTGDWKI